MGTKPLLPYIKDIPTLQSNTYINLQNRKSKISNQLLGISNQQSINYDVNDN